LITAPYGREIVADIGGTRGRAVGIEMAAAGIVTDAMRRAAREARAGDRIVVFGFVSRFQWATALR
jgi:hypothetical protein